MAGIPTVPATEGDNPTPAPTEGQPGIGYDDTLPGVHPTTDDLQLQVTQYDWPPAAQQGPDDPADTPGYNDDALPAVSGPPDND